MNNNPNAQKALISSLISLIGPIPGVFLSMIIFFGHLGVFLPLVLFIFLIFGIRGIILSIVSLSKGESIGMAVAALIAGILGSLISLPGMLVLGACGMMWDHGF